MMKPNQPLPSLPGVSKSVVAALMALAVTRVMRKAVREDEELAHRMLGNTWKLLRPTLEPLMLAGTNASAGAAFLDLYFTHRGDWQRMETVGFGVLKLLGQLNTHEVEQLVGICEDVARQVVTKKDGA